MQTIRTFPCIFRGQVALFGMHSLDTDECKPPCQMRVVDTVVATNVSYETYDNDFAVVTIYPPLEFTDEVGSFGLSITSSPTMFQMEGKGQPTPAKAKAKDYIDVYRSIHKKRKRKRTQ